MKKQASTEASGLYYKNITIVNDTSKVTSEWHQSLENNGWSSIMLLELLIMLLELLITVLELSFMLL